MRPRPPPREWWINAYELPGGEIFLGAPHLSRRSARLHATISTKAGTATWKWLGQLSSNINRKAAVFPPFHFATVVSPMAEASLSAPAATTLTKLAAMTKESTRCFRRTLFIRNIRDGLID